jgi:hypothetical protein
MGVQTRQSSSAQSASFKPTEVVVNMRAHSGARIYRLVIAMVALVLIASVVGAIVLMLPGQSTWRVAVALALATAGSVAGLLAPSPWSKPS